MFESFKINIAALEALAHECPMPRNVPTADRSQDFYEKILETCTHEGVIDGADLSALNFPFDTNNDTPIHYDVFISLYITFFYYLCIEIQHQGVE